MSIEKSTRLHVPVFDSLKVGEVNLGVPIIGDVIQVGTLNSKERTRLIVQKDIDRILVERQDGSPIQFRMHVNKYVAARKDEPSSYLLFGEPILGLNFFKSLQEQSLPIWELDESIPVVADQILVEQLAKTIGTFANSKQQS